MVDPRAGELASEEQAKLATAARLAIEWHGRQTRKGSALPYVNHLFQVAGLVLEHGGDVDQAVAGFLHDALEDAETPGARAERVRCILEEFGPKVLRMILDCTDTEEHEHVGAKAPWRERKTRYLDHVPKCDPRSLLLTAGDKRHNLGALVADLREHGPGYLDRFNTDKEAQAWYFDNVLKALEGNVPEPSSRELGNLLDEFRELA